MALRHRIYTVSAAAVIMAVVSGISGAQSISYEVSEITENPLLLEAATLYDSYDYDGAAEKLSLFRKKTRKPTEQDKAFADEFSKRVELAQRSLANMQRVVVIDSLSVPYDYFFKSYKLPPSAGRIIPPEDMPQTEARDNASMAYSNEAGDYMIWSQPDSVGTLRIVESNLLTDGSWSDPVQQLDNLNPTGDADYPFLTTDGSTLYFASDGEGSIGGLDIFVATRDPQTGECLAPVNIGMPFNSPYDDYLLAIDEEHGVGWWATDRNQIPGMVTVYVYLLADNRSNVDPETDNIKELASLSNYRSTWEEGKDYADLASEIQEIDPNPKKHEDFRLPMPGGVVYTLFSDFKNNATEALMRRYLEAQEELQADTEELAALRRSWHKQHSRQLAAKILELEKSVEKQRENVHRMLSDVYRSESQSNR